MLAQTYELKATPRKNYENKYCKLTEKHYTEMINLFINNEDIINYINQLKDKIVRTPETIPSFFIKHIISSLIFPISFIFNLSLALSSVPNQWKCSYVIQSTKN